MYGGAERIPEQRGPLALLSAGRKGLAVEEDLVQSANKGKSRLPQDTWAVGRDVSVHVTLSMLRTKTMALVMSKCVT